mmetsp:Transcript_6541/g.5835  ORF Transcript_6541/g.5835 Transcript_6541/m.5835 type:complete len:259 (+) Transcript_6541:3231-4007(+)
MSMVGYILGLGDRHPSNIMLDRFSGKVVHIDFGDCFELAMRREKFPEKIPFRLTRMLIKAMEVSGIEGNFKTTCENTMRVLRASKESLLAILEAFVYDPLISFKLLNPKMLKQHQQEKAQDQIAGQVNLEEKKADPPANDKSINRRQSIVKESLHRENLLEKGEFGGKDDHIESKLSRKLEEKEMLLMIEEEGEDARRDELNQTAELVISRISDKLKGREFHNIQGKMDINDQVDNLIKQATSHENLAQCYIGWCPYW